MANCIQPTTARFPRRLVRLAAAVTGLTTPSAAADTPSVSPPIEAEPRSPHLRSSYQTWLAFTAQGPVREPLLVSLDLLGGFYPDMHPLLLQVRPSIGVRLPHGFQLHAAYAYTALWDEKHRFVVEHDPSQQLFYQAPIKVVDIMSRVRLEERVRAGSDVGFRLRVLGQVNIPLWERAPLQVDIWNELFLGLNRPGPWQPSVLDQDLYFVGFGWQPSFHLRVEFGYQGAVVPWPGQTDLIHSASVSTTAQW